MATISFKHGAVQFLNDTNSVLASGTVEFFEPDGAFTTNKDTYTTKALSVANSNPMTLAASGRLANDVFLDGDYDYRIKDSAGVIITSPQNINPVSGAASFSISADAPLSATHAGGLVEASGTTTLTLDTAATLTEGWWTRVSNVGSGTVTFARNDATNTIDGVAGNITLSAGGGITIAVNNGETGFITFKTSELSGLLTTAGDMLYASAANTPTRLAVGNSGQIPSVNAAEDAISYWTPRNYIAGLEITSNGAAPTTDIDIAAGDCADSTNANVFKIVAVTREMDVAYGTGNGGLSSSLTVSANTTYYIHAIRAGTTEDVGFDTSATAANLITDHTVTEYRQIGTFSTNAGDTDIDVNTIRTLGSSVRVAAIANTKMNRVTALGNNQMATNKYGGVTTTATAYTKLIEIQIPSKGDLRISFRLKGDGSATQVYARIYKNGAALGTQRNNNSASFVTYSQDFTGFAIGDLVQLYAYTTNGATPATVDRFELLTNEISLEYIFRI